MTPDRLLSEKWLKGFLSRIPEVKGKKPRALNILRAKAVTEDAVNSYFTELRAILEKYDLMAKPQLIINIDESGLSPEHIPRTVLGSAHEPTPAITSPRGSTTTVIAGCTASGQAIPPMFVFKGKRQTGMY